MSKSDPKHFAYLASVPSKDQCSPRSIQNLSWLIGHDIHVAFIGHSLTRWFMLPEQNVSCPGVYFNHFTRSGAKISQFETYPEFTQVLENRYNLAIIWLGGNYISEDCNVRDIIQTFRKVDRFFSEKNIPILQTVRILFPEAGTIL